MLTTDAYGSFVRVNPIRTEDDRERIMRQIRKALEGLDIELLSNRIGVSKSAIYALKSGRTKWPRPSTMFSLLPFLGLRLVLVKA